ASSRPPMRTAGLRDPVDPVLAEVAPAIDDDGGNAGATQPIEFLEGRSNLRTGAGFSQGRHQMVGVEARAQRGPANGLRLVDVERLGPSPSEESLTERVTPFHIGRVEGAGWQFLPVVGQDRPARRTLVKNFRVGIGKRDREAFRPAPAIFTKIGADIPVFFAA